MVPDVSALLPTTLGMPCYPLAGKQMGTSFVPQIGAGVWIEFEGGDPDYPIWIGCFWGIGAELPADAAKLLATPVSPSIVLQTTLQNRIVISDLPRADRRHHAEDATGATIIVNDTGIYIENGKGASIMMVGPTVTINNGALTIV